MRDEASLALTDDACPKAFSRDIAQKKLKLKVVYDIDPDGK